MVAPYYVPALASLISDYGVGTVPAGAGSQTVLSKHTLNRQPFIQASYMNPDDFSAVAGAGLRVYRLREHTLVRDVSDGGTADRDKRPGYVRVYLDLPGTYRIVEKVPVGYTPIGGAAVTRTLSVSLMAPVNWLLAPTVSPT